MLFCWMSNLQRCWLLNRKFLNTITIITYLIKTLVTIINICSLSLTMAWCKLVQECNLDKCFLLLSNLRLCKPKSWSRKQRMMMRPDPKQLRRWIALKKLWNIWRTKLWMKPRKRLWRPSTRRSRLRPPTTSPNGSSKSLRKSQLFRS